ncbi:ATP-binding cassette domain-containing protein [Streptomyces sp. NPDC057521]|uniref:ABC transporter ATP-binding protein n=1 Tax=Streptomyces sp. NPDC057521 TaxID=3346156 RepID=UPI0036A21381
MEIRDVVRTYGSGSKTRYAVNGVSLSIERGEFFGILGPNGAGKTTLMKMILTTLLPTQGSISVLGHDVERDVRRVRRSIGCVLGGDNGFYDRLTALQNMTYFADLYEVPYRRQRARIQDLLELVGLSDRAQDKVETFSRGMKQRLHVARSLVHDPQVVILDEPTNGLDPVGARDLRNLCAGLIARDKTVILTTHYMPEADEMCKRLVVMVGGQVVAAGKPADIKEAAGTVRVTEIECPSADDDTVARLRAVDGVTSVHVEVVAQRHLVQIQSRSDAESVPGIVAIMEPIGITRLMTREPTLEDAYIALVSAAAITR